MLCNRQPVIFAHSVLPLAGLRGGWNSITRLGSRSLGEALFNNPRIQRQSMAYLRIRAPHPLHRALRQSRPDYTDPLWARRSIFCLKGHPLMVTEVFLPGMETV